MTSTVICGYSGASWEINSVGQDACQQYAALVGTCQSGFTVGPVTPTSPQYLPVAGNAACSCNVVAYNLQAACGWCQDAIQPSWWATQTEWSGNCTSFGTAYDATGLPSTVSTASLTIPAWALATVAAFDLTWNPSSASLLSTPNPTAVGGGATTGFATDTGFPTGLGYTYPGTTIYPFATNDPYGVYGQVAAASSAAVAIGVGVTVGMWALSGIIVALVFFMRQKKRKAWYGPTAAFYASGGMGGGQPGLAGAPLLFHNEPNIHGSPNPTTINSLPSHSPAPSSGAYAPYQPPPPGPQATSSPYTPYQPYSSDARQSYVPPPGSGGGGYMGGGGGGSEAHGYPPNTPGTNPFNTPYATPGGGGPPQGPPAGAGPAGYSGHAEVY